MLVLLFTPGWLIFFLRAVHSATRPHAALLGPSRRAALCCAPSSQAFERQVDALSRQLSKAESDAEDVARQRETILEELRASQQVRSTARCRSVIARQSSRHSTGQRSAVRIPALPKHARLCGWPSWRRSPSLQEMQSWPISDQFPAVPPCREVVGR